MMIRNWFKKKEKPTTTNTQWAFWRTADFPYFSSGAVSGFTEDGKKAIVYGRGEVDHFHLAVGAEGEELNRLGSLIASRYRMHMECARNSAGNAAFALLRNAGFPTNLIPELRRNGYQGQAYRVLFSAGLPEKFKDIAMQDGLDQKQ